MVPFHCSARDKKKTCIYSGRRALLFTMPGSTIQCKIRFHKMHVIYPCLEGLGVIRSAFGAVRTARLLLSTTDLVRACKFISCIPSHFDMIHDEFVTLFLIANT